MLNIILELLRDIAVVAVGTSVSILVVGALVVHEVNKRMKPLMTMFVPPNPPKKKDENPFKT